MTEQEKREQRLRELAEIIRRYHAEMNDQLAVCKANAWVLAADIVPLDYSVGQMNNFFNNETVITNTHGVNFDKARFIA